MRETGKRFTLRRVLLAPIGLIACLWIVMGSFPTGWIYDLGVGTGTEQGQRPSGDAVPLRGQDEVEWFFWRKDPAAVTGSNLIRCPLVRLRDPRQEGEHTHRRNGTKRTVYIPEYCVFSYPIDLFDTVRRLLFTSGAYNSYHLLELADGSYLCVYFDDYLLYQSLFQGEVQYPAGYVRYSTTEERRMLNQMLEDYEVNPVYVLDMYRYGKSSWVIDLSLRIGLALVLAIAFFAIEERIAQRIAKCLEVRRNG